MCRTARWLTRHHHHIHWDDGKITYSKSLIRELCNPFDIIYTKGLEKVTFLKRFHPNVYEYQGECANIVNNTHCTLPQHAGDFDRCALHTAYKRYMSLAPV